MTLAIVAGAIVLENGFKYAIHRARPEAFFWGRAGIFQLS
jgi:hypothetical protein